MKRKKRTVKKKEPVKPVQKKENNNSHFSLFGAKAGFTTEPLWFRLTVIIIIVVAVLALGYILKEWALPAIGQQVLRSGTTHIINVIKGRAP